MASVAHEEYDLSQKHEDILKRRGLLLQQMEALYERQKTRKKRRCVRCEAASARNDQILEDLENVERKLHTRQLFHPDIIHLETRYWASVEQKLPEWEQYLLGKGKAPVNETDASVEHRLKSGQHQPSPTHSRGKPPRPKPRK